MPNPIADPFVENAVSPDLEALIDVRSDSRGVVSVIINGVGPTNALNGEVALALREAFETLHGADAARVMFLCGAGGAFSSGQDPAWVRAAAEDWEEDEAREDAMAFAQMLHALARVPALTVALIDGEAAGPGAALVAACDMAFATPASRFAFSEAREGVAPAVAAPYVVNAVGPRQARALLMTGRPIDAAEAQRIGLVDAVVEASALAAAAERVVGDMMKSGPQAAHEAKRLAWDVWDRPLDHHLIEETVRRQAESRLGEEGREGLNAALEGRAPGWASP
jgi:methylglutaconyl-CoA hydratase